MEFFLEGWKIELEYYLSIYLGVLGCKMRRTNLDLPELYLYLCGNVFMFGMIARITMFEMLEIQCRVEKEWGN